MGVGPTDCVFFFGVLIGAVGSTIPQGTLIIVLLRARPLW